MGNALDRRRHPRVSIDVEVDVKSGTNFYAARVRDISVGGVFIALPLAPDVGAEIGLVLHLGGQRLSLVGRCAWILFDDANSPIGFGAELINPPRAAKRAINTFMMSRAPMVFELLEADSEDRAPVADNPVRKTPPPLPV